MSRTPIGVIQKHALTTEATFETFPFAAAVDQLPELLAYLTI